MITGAAGGILFAVGMCMCLLPEWEAFDPGLVTGSIGALILLLTPVVWRKAEGKTLRLNAKTVGVTLFGIAGSLALGVGMCFVMLWNSIILGMIIGVVGIIMLLSLIPMIKGFKKVGAEVRS